MPILDASGVLCDDTGKVQALWATYQEDGMDDKGRVFPQDYFIGFPVHHFRSAFEALQRNETPSLYALEVELSYMQISQARCLGLTDELVHKIEQANAAKRNVMGIRRLTSGTDASKKLREGDIVVSVNGKIATAFGDITDANAKEMQLVYPILPLPF